MCKYFVSRRCFSCDRLRLSTRSCTWSLSFGFCFFCFREIFVKILLTFLRLDVFWAETLLTFCCNWLFFPFVKCSHVLSFDLPCYNFVEMEICDLFGVILSVVKAFFCFLVLNASGLRRKMVLWVFSLFTSFCMIRSSLGVFPHCSCFHFCFVCFQFCFLRESLVGVRERI